MQSPKQAGCDSESSSLRWRWQLREREDVKSAQPKWDYIAVVFNANKDEVSK